MPSADHAPGDGYRHGRAPERLTDNSSQKANNPQTPATPAGCWPTGLLLSGCQPPQPHTPRGMLDGGQEDRGRVTLPVTGDGWTSHRRSKRWLGHLQRVWRSRNGGGGCGQLPLREATRSLGAAPRQTSPRGGQVQHRGALPTVPTQGRPGQIFLQGEQCSRKGGSRETATGGGRGRLLANPYHLIQIPSRQVFQSRTAFNPPTTTNRGNIPLQVAMGQPARSPRQGGPL
jgi:hypothetical protein